MDKGVRNAIERATQRARKLLEDDFTEQLEGTFDVLRTGAIAPTAGSHLSPRRAAQREKVVAAIRHKRATGMSAAAAAADYLRDAAFTTLNRFVALKICSRHVGWCRNASPRARSLWATGSSAG